MANTKDAVIVVHLVLRKGLNLFIHLIPALCEHYRILRKGNGRFVSLYIALRLFNVEMRIGNRT